MEEVLNDEQKNETNSEREQSQQHHDDTFPNANETPGKTERSQTNVNVFPPSKKSSIASVSHQSSSSMEFDGLCPWRCGQSVTFETLNHHVYQCNKANAHDQCPFQVLGCTYDGSIDVKEHMLMENASHASLLVPHVLKNMVSQDKTDSAMQHQAEDTADLKRRLENESTKNSILSNEVCQLKRELAESNKKLNSLEKDMAVVRSTFDVLLRELNSVKNQAASEERIKSVEETTDKLKLENANVTKSVVENHSLIMRLDERINNVNSNLGDVDLRQQILENTSVGGRFIWKIDRLRSRIKHSALGKVAALHSAPCFTKRFGYKFCTRLYLNGDGVGKDTHVSLFIVIMRSEYDALLEWPFRQKVTFNLFNYANPNDSLKESFIPDVSSPSFKRPHKEMNLAAGCPMFVTKERLETFILDDSIYIETTVGDV